MVEARLPYVNDGDGMHTVTDPADDATYVAAYAGMDLAQKVFACFDQPDLKAPITLTVRGPERLDGGRQRPARTAQRRTASGRASRPRRPSRRTCSRSAPGPWHSCTWEHAGLPFGWHARASLAAELDRDIEDMRQVTERCFDFYTEHLRRAVPVRLLRPGDGPGPQLGRHGDRRAASPSATSTSRATSPTPASWSTAPR